MNEKLKAIKTIKEMTDGIWELVPDGEWFRPCESCESFNVQFLQTNKDHGNQLKYVCKECGYKSAAIKRTFNKKSDRENQSDWSKAVIEQSGGKCQVPGCTKKATEAHHKVSYQLARQMGLSDYEIWSLSNGIALCPDHHHEWHARNFQLEGIYANKRKSKYK